LYDPGGFVFIASMGWPDAEVVDFTEKELRSWKLLGEFRSMLGEVPPRHAGSGGRPVRKGGPKRLLAEEDYLCAFLFAQFNPIIDSMRGLCAASDFPRVQAEVCSRKMSLGSFSEAQSVFGFERLERLFSELAAGTIGSEKARPGLPPGLLKRLRLVDSTVFHAVPRMAWARWRGGKREGGAVRLHLKFRVADSAPAAVVPGPARLCERKAFEMMVEPDEFYVGDRYYGRDYDLLRRLDETGCGYVLRLYAQAFMTVIGELALTDQDRAAGVVSDRIVRLGSTPRWHLGPVRVVTVEKPGMAEPVVIVTNQLDPQAMSAALVGEIYRGRWEIELFFRWLKCVFGRPAQWHWLAESPEGVGIQLYTALIASLLLCRRMGKLPGKRLMEALRWHQSGMIDAATLARVLGEHAVKEPA
jgi:hypothetical protein